MQKREPEFKNGETGKQTGKKRGKNPPLNTDLMPSPISIYVNNDAGNDTRAVEPMPFGGKPSPLCAKCLLRDAPYIGGMGGCNTYSSCGPAVDVQL